MTILEKYQKIRPKYEDLGKKIIHKIERNLLKEKIDVLIVYYRTKEENSFLEKIERRGYTDPLQEMEDLCAMRVICYYANDITNIEKTIKKSIKIINSFRKEDQLDSDKFGYRSSHLIGIVDSSLSKLKGWNDLIGLKIEIQVRTILMHAWAEIEHKLAYKSETDIAPPHRRKFSQLSALLELGDEQFQLLKDSKNEYQKDLVNEKLVFNNLKHGFSVDLLEAFINLKFNNREGSEHFLYNFYEEMKINNIELKEISNGISLLKKNDFYDEVLFNAPRGSSLTKIGAAKLILDITCEKYWNYRKNKIALEAWTEHVLNYQKKINDSLS